MYNLIRLVELKGGKFDEPQIKDSQLLKIKDSQFIAPMNEFELNTWCSFVEKVQHFLENYNAVNFIIPVLIFLGVSMKIHLDRFLEMLVKQRRTGQKIL